MKIKNMDESIEILKENTDLRLPFDSIDGAIETAVHSWNIDKYSYDLPPEKADALQKFLDNYRTTRSAFISLEDQLGAIFSVMAKEHDMDSIDEMCVNTYKLLMRADFACQKIKNLIPQELAHYASKNIQECNNRRVNESVDADAMTAALDKIDWDDDDTEVAKNLPEDVIKTIQAFVKKLEKNIQVMYDIRGHYSLDFSEDSECNDIEYCIGELLDKTIYFIHFLGEYFKRCLGENSGSVKKHWFKKLKESVEELSMDAVVNAYQNWSLESLDDNDKELLKKIASIYKKDCNTLFAIGNLIPVSTRHNPDFDMACKNAHRMLTKTANAIQKFGELAEASKNLKECGDYCDDNSCEDGECEDELFELFHRKPTLKDAIDATEMRDQFGAEIETLETKIENATDKEKAKLQKELERKQKAAQEYNEVINEYNANLEKAAEKLAKKAAKKNVKESINAYRKDGRLYADNGVSVIYNLEESYEANMNRLERKIKTLDLLHK